MESDKLREAIGRLSGTSLAARLRPLLPEIDRKAREGVRHADIVAALAAEGLTVSLETFRKTLYRYRAAHPPADEPSIGPFGPPPSPAEPAGAASGQDDGRGAPSAPYGATDFEAALDPKTRDALGEKYLARRRPLLGSNRRDGS